LTPQEQEKIRRHAEVSYEIVSRIRLPWEDVPQYIRHHHERPDGTGYPDALPGQELSDGAKILALADAYDAMTSDRPYRARLTPVEAMQEIRRCEGTQFDGRISSILCRLIENGKDASSLKPPVIRRLGGEMALPLLIDIPWRSDA
jgi:HD-GYP domain-containing protein (c-di-GMP phosphodiesterase class II)